MDQPTLQAAIRSIAILCGVLIVTLGGALIVAETHSRPDLTFFVGVNDERMNLPPPAPQPAVNVVSVTPTGVTLWNDTPVDNATLATFAKVTTTLAPQPYLNVKIDGRSSYGKVREVMKIIRDSGVGRVGMITADGTVKVEEPEVLMPE